MSKFKVGDKVIAVKNTPDTEEGFIGYVAHNEVDQFGYICVRAKNELRKLLFKEDELELLSRREEGVIHKTTINASVSEDFSPRETIARPILEERKIGKVQMELFDEGFPNAVLEVARVMTWAAENKGYKPHDWKLLPDADTQFSAAASRHKVKSFIQKVEGVPALQRTDEESKIVHLAHTAFNVLAELELVLTGVIK